MRKLRSAVAAILAGAGLLAAGTLPAPADVVRFRDSRHDDPVAVTNIRWVQVDNVGSRLKVVTRVGTISGGPDGGPPWQALFIDTRRRNPGPEYRVTSAQDFAMHRVNGWRDEGRYVDPTSCGGRRAIDVRYARSGGRAVNRIVVSFRRQCVRDPQAIRVASHTGVYGSHLQRRGQDWAADRRDFLPWVPR